MRIVPLLLVPSGCAALIYQVVWVRLLGLSMGSTSAAVSTVLAAFFLGLAIGSYFAEKFSHRERTKLTTFVPVQFCRYSRRVSNRNRLGFLDRQAVSADA